MDENNGPVVQELVEIACEECGAFHYSEGTQPCVPPEPVGGQWRICGDCGGDGRHVHDDIAIPDAEMRADREAMARYWGGAYDVDCKRCKTTGKVHTSNDPGPQRNITSNGMSANGDSLNAYGNPRYEERCWGG